MMTKNIRAAEEVGALAQIEKGRGQMTRQEKPALELVGRSCLLKAGGKWRSRSCCLDLNC